MSTIDFKSLSAEQQAELMAQAAQAAKEKEMAVTAERETYKELVNEAVGNSILHLQRISNGLGRAKATVYNSFRDLITMKCELFGTEKGDQRSHTFTNREGTQRITLGYHVQDNYDDTVNAGIEKVQEYLSSLATDDKSAQLVSMVQKLMSKDVQGNLKASRVLQLKKYATESGDAEFMDAVGIIEAAYQPVKSKQYVRAEYKDDESNEWKSVPLGMTEA